MAGSLTGQPIMVNLGPNALPPVYTLCRNCKHARRAWEHLWDDNATCWRDPQLSLVTGEFRSLRLCVNERAHTGLCGPDAKFFQPMDHPT